MLKIKATDQAGFSLLEVLITILIASFALLGLAALEYRSTLTQNESAQRVQAEIVLNNFADRIKSRPDNAAAYVTTTPLGTGETANPVCSSLTDLVARDQCEIRALLIGRSEIRSNANVGSALNARACVTEVRATNPASGVCAPGIYQVTIAWQGLAPTRAPTNDCASGSYGTGADDAFRRVISTRVIIPVPACT